MFTLFSDTSLVSGVSLVTGASLVSPTCGLVVRTALSFVSGFSVSVTRSGVFSCFGSVVRFSLSVDWAPSPSFDVTIVVVSVLCSLALTWSKL